MFWATNDLLSTFSFSDSSLGWWWPCGIVFSVLVGLCLVLFLFGPVTVLILWSFHGFQWVRGPYSTSLFCPWAPLVLLEVPHPPMGWAGSEIWRYFLIPHWVACTIWGCIYSFFIVSVLTCWVCGLTLEIETCKSLFFWVPTEFIWGFYNLTVSITPMVFDSSSPGVFLKIIYIFSCNLRFMSLIISGSLLIRGILLESRKPLHFSSFSVNTPKVKSVLFLSEASLFRRHYK